MISEPAQTVLLVDDDEDCHLIYGAHLRHIGYEVLGARDGLEGVEVTLVRLPSVVVMDVRLPKLDGLEATTRLKADPRSAAIPIIVLSAHAEKVMFERAEKSGCDAFLTKPCTPADLAAAIERVVSGKTGGIERRRSPRSGPDTLEKAKAM
jgi:two-component system, cell cycle response regulator DivK